MGIFSPPDFEKMRRDGDMPRLIYWALHDKAPTESRAAMTVLRKDVDAVVEYLYETAMWAESHSVGRRKRLPTRSIRLLNEAGRALTRLGTSAVAPLVSSIRVYDAYGHTDENARYLYHVLVFDVLDKIGSPAADGLRELAADPHRDVRKLAREALEKLEARGLLDDEDDEPDEGKELEEDEPDERDNQEDRA
jgi:hypothetical protein